MIFSVYLANVNVGIALKLAVLMALFIFYLLKSTTTFFIGKNILVLMPLMQMLYYIAVLSLLSLSWLWFFILLFQQ
jgi:hypothetical protein